MFGRKACQLVKEFASGEKGQLTPFNVSPDLHFSVRHSLLYFNCWFMLKPACVGENDLHDWFDCKPYVYI